ELVYEALACFAQVDVREDQLWPRPRQDGVAISPNFAMLASTLPGGEVEILSTSDRTQLCQLPAPDFQPGYTYAKFSMDSKLLAVRYEAGSRSEWRVWDLDQRLGRVESKDAPQVNALDFSPTGGWMALGTKAKSLRLVDLSTGATLKEVARRKAPREVALHPGGQPGAVSGRA